MDLLKRELAPITSAAWEAIDGEARDALKSTLSARRVVDVGAPWGDDFAAVNLGRVEPVSGGDDEVRLGIRKVLPLVEVRVPFEVALAELDAAERGTEDPDFDDLHRAVKALARFEDQTIYEGYPDAGIEGLISSSKFDPVTLPADAGELPDAITNARMHLHCANVGGPYALVLGVALYRSLMSGSEGGYPVRHRVEDEIGGPIVLAPFLTGGALVSRRGGDAELVLGRDVGVKYEGHDGETVRLSFLESFTFRNLGPEAVIALRTGTPATD